MKNNTRFNNSIPPVYYINGKQVRSMYFNGNQIYNYIPCVNLRLNAGEIIFTKGHSFTLIPTVMPSNCTEPVLFRSSNPAVATVNDKGVITSVGLGTCDIIVTCDNRTINCKVHVKEETIYLYKRGVLNNNTEFGQMVYPQHSSFVFESKNIFLNLAGQYEGYGTIWFSWANMVNFGEFTTLHMDITNDYEHTTVIGMTRNRNAGNSGYQNGSNTPVDGNTFIEDRNVITLLKGNNKHTFDVDLLPGSGYLGLYFKRDNRSNDYLEDFIDINTIYLIRKSVYVVGTAGSESEKALYPCTSLAFSRKELEIEYVGDNTVYNLRSLLNVAPSNCDEPITWDVIDNVNNSVDVGNNGYIYVNNTGTFNINAICGVHFDSIQIKSVISCTGIEISGGDMSFTAAGVNLMRKATVSPINTTDEIIWVSSNENVATVSQDGIITSVGTGTCVISAICGDFKDDITVNVDIPITCDSITLDRYALSLDVSGSATATLKATIMPSNTTYPITWSSRNPSIATVVDGKVTAKSPGTTMITASCGNKSISGTVTVLASCTSIVLDKAEVTLNISGTVSTILKPILQPANTTDVVKWNSLNKTVADVIDGVVTAKAPGNATIVATCGNKSVSCNIIVKASCTSISLDESSVTLDLSGTATTTLIPKPIPSNTTNEITWSSSNTTVVTVDDGVLTARTPGSATITVTCGTKTTSCTVRVTASCTAIALNKTNTTLNLSGTATTTLIPTLSPSNTTDAVVWVSSNTSIATVLDGVVTAKANGSTTITATCGNKSATCYITVGSTCTGLSFTITSLTIGMDASNYNIAEYLKVTPSSCTDTIVWSSNKTNIVTVSSTGKLVAKSPGSATITVTCGSKTATCPVTVVSYCTGVSLSSSSMTLDLSGTKTATLTATLTPSNTTDTVTWSSSNTSVATVNNGVVTAKANGSATITVTCGNKSATCAITVKTSCTSVSLDRTSASLDISGITSGTLKLTKVPSNTTDTVTWKSSNTSVATVNSSGTVTAVAPGTTVISVTCGNKTAQCNISVKASCTSITLNPVSTTLTVGGTQTISETVTPRNTTDTVTWKSSNTSVATVNSVGTVTGIGKGTATITATCGGKSATCIVTVTELSIVLSADKSYMVEGEMHTFYVYLQPGALAVGDATMYNMHVNTSKDSISLSTRIVSNTEMIVIVRMLYEESAAVNFNLTYGDKTLLARFEVYPRV